MSLLAEEIFYRHNCLCQKRAFRILVISGGSLMAVLGFVLCLFRILISKEMGDGGVGNAIVAPTFIIGLILTLFGLGVDFITVFFKKYSYKIAYSLIEDFLYDYPQLEYLNQLRPLLAEMADSQDKDPKRIYQKLKELRFIEKKRRRI